MKNLTVSLLAITLLLSLTACGPSPEAVCDHMLEVAKKEATAAGGEAAAKAIEEELPKDECIEKQERSKEMKGMIKYKEKASCIVAAETLEAMDAC